MLDPHSFGLVSLTTIFIAISYAIVDGGFEKVIIQKKEVDEIQINTIFLINVLISAALLLTIWLISPSIALYFEELELTQVLRISALTIPLSALGQVHRTQLLRDLKIKQVTVSQLYSSLALAFSGILLALLGFGVWALVYSNIIGVITWLIAVWSLSSWKIRLAFSLKSIRPLMPMGMHVLTSSLIFFILLQINAIIIGKFFGTNDLGLYSRALKFPEVVVTLGQAIILRMALPMFSKVQYQQQEYKKLMSNFTKLISAFLFPCLAVIFIFAENIIEFTLTKKWLESAVIVKFLCVSKIFDPFITLQREFILSKGKSKLLLHCLVATGLVEVLTLSIAAMFSMQTLLFVAILNKAMQFWIYTSVLNRLRMSDTYFRILEMMPYLLSTIAASSLSYTLCIPFSNSPILQMCLGCTTLFLTHLIILDRFGIKEVINIDKVASFTRIKSKLLLRTLTKIRD